MRNCNLDLCLAQPVIPTEHAAAEVLNNYDITSRQRKEDGVAAGNQNCLTIFYNGEVCVCDVTELQANLIISQAKKEAQDMTIRQTECNLLPLLEPNSSNSILRSAPSSPSSSVPPPLSSCISTVPMRNSLEQFLQKRKNRISAAAPYHRKSLTTTN